MNKYKIISAVLAVSLLASLVRLVYTTNIAPKPADAAQTKDVVMQNILSRKSVRSYTEQPVSREHLDTLVRAAMAAPTARDIRPWHFVIVDERETLDSLAAALPRAKMLAEAPAAIIVCGEPGKTTDDGHTANCWHLDCSAATENLLLQAEAMGLGAVWCAAYPYDDRIDAVRTAVAMPDDIVPFSIVPIGHPKGDPQPKDKYDTEAIHYNGW